MATLKKITDANAEIKDEEKDFTAQETNNQIKQSEQDFISALLDAAEDKNEKTKTEEIRRHGKLYFSFGVHGLSEEEAFEARKKYTKYVKNKSTGIRVPTETDTNKFHSALIYMATSDEDRAKIWDNKQLREALVVKGYQIVSYHDVMEAILLAGEKGKIIDDINELSGFDTEETESAELEREEEIKNS